MGIQTIFQMADAGIGKLKDLVADAAELDDAYADVMKTTGLTRDEVLKLNESFKKMDTRTAREQLNQLAYEAGKLGINSTQQVEQFVRAADKINIALGDVLGEGAMVTIGKLADVYSKSTAQLTAAGDDLEKKMLSIGSAVNQLGQSSTANCPQQPSKSSSCSSSRNPPSLPPLHTWRSRNSPTSCSAT